MVTIITSTSKSDIMNPKSAKQRQSSGRRLQIRGFPKIWTETLTHEDISWYLFDLLGNYGPIDGIVISQSKKDSLIYGMVDMLREKDASRIMNELLDENKRLSLPSWHTVLSFRQIDLYAPTTSPDEQSSDAKIGFVGDPNSIVGGHFEKSSQSVVNDKETETLSTLAEALPTTEGTCPPKTEEDKEIIAKSDNIIIYSRDKILSLRPESNADNSYKLDLEPQLQKILRRANIGKFPSGNGNRYEGDVYSGNSANDAGY